MFVRPHQKSSQNSGILAPKILHFPANEPKASGRRRVLFISTWRIACGIATFTDTLVSHLKEDLDCGIFVLDPDFFASSEPRVVQVADHQIEALREVAQDYDAVNLQWEPGTLGPNPSVSRRRLEAILRTCPRLICTVHSPMPPTQSLGKAIRRAIAGLVHRQPSSLLTPLEWLRADSGRSYRALRHAGLQPNRMLTIAVHTLREASYFRNALGMPRVYDHPLSHIRQHWRHSIAQDAAATREELKRRFGGRKLLATFGFLSPYKGTETAIRAMRHLPDEWQLLIYGSVHPGVISNWAPINPYVEQLLKLLEGGTSIKSRRRAKALQKRVTFMGSPDDYEFACAVGACDAVVFPYLEVGQSSSGPVSLAIELAKPTYLSHNRTFVEYNKYFPGNFEFFDVGNHLQLANLVETAKEMKKDMAYDCSTQTEHYLRMIEEVAGGALYIRPVPLLSEASGDQETPAWNQTRELAT